MYISYVIPILEDKDTWKLVRKRIFNFDLLKYIMLIAIMFSSIRIKKMTASVVYTCIMIFLDDIHLKCVELL